MLRTFTPGRPRPTPKTPRCSPTTPGATPTGLSWTTPSDELLVRLGILNGRDADLAADATRAANRLRDALLTVSPALERAVGDKLSSSGGARDALARWGTPTALRDAGKARVRTRIAKRSPRTAQAAARRRLTDAIWGALDAQSVTVTAEATWCDTITELAADLDRGICARRDQLATTIEDAFMDHPLGKVLASLCGFGPRTGARTLAEIGDPNRFADGGRLAAYAGLAPVDWQSGRSATVRKPRGGNHRLKNAMFTAAFVATQHDPDARAYYQRKRSEGKRHNAAVICVARRRCNIILAMLKTQTPHQPPQPQNLQIQRHLRHARRRAHRPRPAKPQLGRLVELADMPERERPQKCPQRRRRQRRQRQHRRRRARPQPLRVVDTAPAHQHRRHQRQHLATRA